MYIYFDTNGTIKEIVNDKSIRQGSTEANKIYCYIEGNPTIDDIWYMQKLPSGETSNEVSFKNSTVTKAIPYDAKRDMKYFKDFEQYTFYVFTLNAFLVSQKGLNLATIRIVVDNEIFALGELTFNVQENVINVDNGITISQYDYLLLAYASRTLNEVTANDLDALLDDKINAKIGDLANGSPKVFDTEANIEAMHDDEGIAVATDTGYIYVWNDTQEQYISTGMLYLQDASTTVYHTGNVLEDGNGNTIYPEIANESVTEKKISSNLFNLLLKYGDITNITSSFTLQNRYLDKANGNANPDANSRCTDFIDLSLYNEFLISGFSQYATCMICTYDENQQFLRYYCDGGSGGTTYTDYRFVPQSDEKYVKFGTYQYTTHPLVIKSVGQVISIAQEKQWNVLYGKKYVACGDSFTKGDVIASDKVYPYLIAQRNNMTLVNMSANGSYAHNGADGFTNSSNSYYYQNIPLDADYITIAYGLNEISTTIGDKTSSDNTTIWGAYNEILTWIITNIPNAKVGIISNDAWMTYELRNALQEIASYYGVSFLDLKEYGKTMMISGKYTEDGDVNSTIKNLRTNQYCVSNLNGHPNELGHRVRSYIIENFLRGMDDTDNRYTKKEVETKLSAKQDTLTFDNTPTENSTNPVTSGGVYNAINGAHIDGDNINFEIDYSKYFTFIQGGIGGYGEVTSYNKSLQNRIMTKQNYYLKKGTVITILNNDYDVNVVEYNTKIDELNSSSSNYFVYLSGYVKMFKIVKDDYYALTIRKSDNSNLTPNFDISSILGINIENAIINIPHKATICDGIMKLPNEFGTLPFNIIKSQNKYNIDLSKEQLNINPIKIYVSDSATSTGLGTDINEPITLYQVKQNLISNLYSNKNIKIIFKDETYLINDDYNFDIIGTGQDNNVTNITFDSLTYTWLGIGTKPTWSYYNDNIYQCSSSIKVSDLVDINNLKSNGMPNLYVKKLSISDLTNEGDFCQVDNIVYVYPRATNDINSLILVYGKDYSTSKKGIITISKNSSGNVIFNNIGFLLDTCNFKSCLSLNVWHYFFNCRFHRGSQDSIAFDGLYKTILIDCIADYSSKDCFNYHSTSKDCVAIELNCIGYGAGQYKLDTIGANNTTYSNNASTAHNGLCVARFNCEYYDCEGSPVADVYNCVSYCVECSVKNILMTNTGEFSAYRFADNTDAPLVNRTTAPTIHLYNCKCGGDNVIYGLSITGLTIKVDGFEGITSVKETNNSIIDIINITL